MRCPRAARGFFEERVRSAIGHHFSHRMGGGESKQDQVVQAPAPTPSEPPAAPAPKAEPTVAPKMSEPTAAPELKEYPEFPGEKLSKRCVYTAVRSAMARDVRGGRGCAGCTVGALSHTTGVTRTERCRRCVLKRHEAASRRDRGRLTASRSPPPVGPRTRKQSPNSRVFNRPDALSRSRRTRPESLTLPIPRPHHPQRVQEEAQGCAERQGQG